eukprot:878940-Amphidinium_carterae.1
MPVTRGEYKVVAPINHCLAFWVPGGFTTTGNKMDVLDEVKSAEDPTADAKLTDAHVAEPVKLTLEGTSSCEEGRR